MSASSSNGNLDTIFSQFGDRVLLRLPSGEETSYSEFRKNAEAQARHLLEMGLTPGDRLLIKLENSPDLLSLYLACALAGLVACPTDPASPATRIALLQRELTPKLVVDRDTLSALRLPPGASAPALPKYDEQRDFVIIYSSGTTAEPKGIVHTVRSLTESAKAFNELTGLGDGSVIYHHFPMFYMAGIFNLFLCPVMAGATIVVGQRFSSLQMLRFWDAPKASGVNHLTVTPTMALSLCQLYRRDDSLLEHISKYQAIISTSSTLYGSIAKRFYDIFGIPLQSCYGVTEVGGSITLQGWDDALALDSNSVGRHLPIVQIRAGTNAGNATDVLIKTPFMMKGYITRGKMISPFDDDGFFRTGDVGYCAGDSLFLTGRESDTVKKGGEFVSLPQIEDLSLSSPHVSDVAAVAVPDEYWGNKIVLFYIPTPQSDIDGVERELSDLFAQRLRQIEIPDKLIPVPAMPKTSIGKTVKRSLVERYTI